jgi:hypothetical protein
MLAGLGRGWQRSATQQPAFEGALSSIAPASITARESLLVRSGLVACATGAASATPTISMKDCFDQTGRPAHRSASKG